jgi:hypothetical protein
MIKPEPRNLDKLQDYWTALLRCGDVMTRITHKEAGAVLDLIGQVRWLEAENAWLKSLLDRATADYLARAKQRVGG